MKKYLTIIALFWQRALAYRFTVFTYRIGEVAEILVLVVMWRSVFGSQPIIGGYTLPEMITYVLVGNFVNACVRNFLSSLVARDIYEGKLSMFLVKPMGYLNYTFTREIGRISLSTIMSVGTQFLVILFFTGSFIWNTDPVMLAVFLIMIVLAFFTELCISYLLGLTAFWIDDVNGVYETYGRIAKFFSGGYFPLSLLPASITSISAFLPFGYSFFVPTQFYLGKIGIGTAFSGIGIQIGWIALLLGLICLVWKRGLKKYEGVGI